MKAFNLEAAMAGEKLVTREGGEAVFIAYVPEASEFFKVIARYGDVVIACSLAGRICSLETGMDLFMAEKEPVTKYLNLAPFGFYLAFDTEEEADTHFTAESRINYKAIKVEIDADDLLVF